LGKELKSGIFQPGQGIEPRTCGSRTRNEPVGLRSHLVWWGLRIQLKELWTRDLNKTKQKGDALYLMEFKLMMRSNFLMEQTSSTMKRILLNSERNLLWSGSATRKAWSSSGDTARSR
jgi:hypothetical protein